MAVQFHGYGILSAWGRGGGPWLRCTANAGKSGTYLLVHSSWYTPPDVRLFWTALAISEPVPAGDCTGLSSPFGRWLPCRTLSIARMSAVSRLAVNKIVRENPGTNPTGTSSQRDRRFLCYRLYHRADGKSMRISGLFAKAQAFSWTISRRPCRNLGRSQGQTGASGPGKRQRARGKCGEIFRELACAWRQRLVYYCLMVLVRFGKGGRVLFRGRPGPHSVYSGKEVPIWPRLPPFTIM